MQRGERQNQRTEVALTSAFSELLQETNYGTISIHTICQRANVGRSTFYRHFGSKADLLVAMHREAFQRFANVYASPTDWLTDQPPPYLVAFLRQRETYSDIPIASFYQFGNDIEYLMRKIDELLAATFLQNLQDAFGEEIQQIPLPILAYSIAGSYGMILRGWFTHQLSLTEEEVAASLQKVVYAAIREALG